MTQTVQTARTRIRLILITVVLAATAAGCLAPAASTPETITVGAPALEQSALLYLAVDQGLFARHGLNVVVQDFESGPAALEALRGGKVDIAETAEYPLVRLLLQGEPLTIVATNDKFENDYLVARPDRGIKEPADLKGKRVGLAQGTIVEFYLARLLELSGIPATDVTVVDLKPDGVVAALAAGAVDGIVTWQPYVSQAERQISGTVVLPAQSGQGVFGLLVARQAWLQQHGEAQSRFLQALREAEDLLIRHPAQAQAVVARRLGFDANYLAAVWPQHHFGLSLDQPLVIAMKDEAQWMIGNQLSQAVELPDFAVHIDATSLAAVKPGAVTIVR